jgi:large subunit ribosomal protein L29
MKITEIRPLGIQELKEKAAALEEELFNLRFQDKMGQLSNPVRLRIVRRDIARIKTIITEKKSAEASSPATTPK